MTKHQTLTGHTRCTCIATTLLVSLLAFGCGKKAETKAPAAQPAAQVAVSPQKVAVSPPKVAVKAKATAANKPQLEGVGVHGKVKFQLRFSPPNPRVGELFQIVTLAAEVTSSKAVLGAKVIADATMPHHGHGMMTEPKHREIGGGTYQHEGFKLHMHGEWTFEVTLERGDLKDRFKAIWKQAPQAL
jgi:hypothetical protein